MHRIALLGTVLVVCPTLWAADDGLTSQASWQRLDAKQIAESMRHSLDELGVLPEALDEATDKFFAAVEKEDVDPLDAYVASARLHVPCIERLAAQSNNDISEAGASIESGTPGYGEIELLPAAMRMSVRTWLGRELIRQRLYDEALPVIGQVDATKAIDPAATLFFRGACYHALLMKKEALVDLRQLLENEEACPIRFSRTAKMMIADIKPLKEDSLDEITRLMTDVTRRLDLGRANEKVQDREQEIIDKLSKLIDKLEQQQQQQQQQQSSSGQSQGNSQGQSSPMQDSRIAGANGNGDVDRKRIEERDGWGNLPPAERQEALQQISRDLPTHYREAIEAYFRKLATDGAGT